MKKILCALACLLTVVEGFSQTSKLIRYLPANTELVVLFNPVQLSKKIPGDVFRESTIYREMMRDNNNSADVNSFLKDPSITGIDFSSDLLFTMETDTSTPYPGNTINIFGVLKNAETFSATMQKYLGEKGTIETFGTNKVLASDEYGPSIAWNNEIFVITNGNRSEIRNMIKGLTLNNDTASRNDFLNEMEHFKEKVKAMAKEHCFRLLTPNNGSPFLSNAHLTGLLKEQGDIKTWSNGAGAIQSLRKISPGLSSLFGKLEALAGTDKISIVNFENGKISGNTRNYVNEKTAALYKKYPAVPQNFNLVRKLPAEGKLLAVISVSAHPDMAKEMLKNSGLEELLDSLKSKLPFDPVLLTSSFGNQLMAAIVSMPEERIITEGEYYKQTDRMFRGIHVIVATPIKNKENFERLYNSLSKAVADLKQKMNEHKEEEFTGEEEEQTEGSFFKGIINSLKLSVKYNDTLCVLSFSDKITGSYLNNPGNGPVPDWFQSAAQYPMIMNFNFKEFINMMASMGPRNPGESDQKMKEMFDVFGDIRVTGGNFSNGSVNSYMEFTFGNKDQNALLQFFGFINNMMGERERYSRIDVMPPDTTTAMIVPAMPEVPRFSDPEVQSYANDYTRFIKDYLDALNTKDMAKMSEVTTKMQSWATRSQSVAQKLSSNAEEAKKFADYMTKLSELLSIEAETSISESKEEPPPPPPSKSKSKTKSKKKN